jgi:hypothetical protein
VLVLAACHTEPAAKRPSAEGSLLLRAVYRDANSTMVLVITEARHAKARGDCTAPMLIDNLTGQARVLSAAEMQTRLRTMQLAWATRSGCPRN